MMKTIYKLAYLPFLIPFIKKSIRHQQQFMQATVLQDLATLKKHAVSNLSIEDVNKITSYYGNAVAAIMGEGFCILRGRKMSANERNTVTYLGAITGIFDDFFDLLKTPVDKIRSMIEDPELAHPANEHEKLFIVFWQNALKTSPSRQQTKQLLHRVADAQEKSIAQSLPDIEESAIREITYEKGAASLLFYRSAFENAPTVTEKNLIETLGKIGQLENDIFDVYKDLQHNIHTLATRCKNISALRLEYATLFQTLEKQLAQTNYPAKNKQKFKSLLAAIVSREYVCLDFLAHKEKQQNNCFEPQSLQRDELICDMEKPTNLLKSLLYYLKI